MSCSIALDLVTNDFTYNFSHIHIKHMQQFIVTLKMIAVTLDTNNVISFILYDTNLKNIYPNEITFVKELYYK